MLTRLDTLLFQQGKSGLKPATAINVRHILCEKHSRATEALEKIQVCLFLFLSVCCSIYLLRPRRLILCGDVFRVESALTRSLRSTQRIRPKVDL